ncbi:hypothetical protein BDN70DRAFT_477879 [Pholiota conissans]|uniref:Myosin N-terminal SH3-like domain-containing protein n=1 Tax=Pholiota conissans TaxID=109636 RepID=A0A9P5YRR0_9AGAR|nr:hypothetical protein BDN70DRAFT_477879 [Pholiota conissans]
MPPRLSQNAEAARAAAQQAEFNEKKWVWVPDIREGYLAGWVNKEEEDSAEVVMASGGEVCSSEQRVSGIYAIICALDSYSTLRGAVQDEPTQI